MACPVALALRRPCSLSLASLSGDEHTLERDDVALGPFIALDAGGRLLPRDFKVAVRNRAEALVFAYGRERSVKHLRDRDGRVDDLLSHPRGLPQRRPAPKAGKP